MLGNLNVTEANLCDDILILKIKGSKEPTGKILNYIGKKLAGNKEAILKVDEYHPKRSLDANSLLWILCSKIAEKIGGTKEEVYRKSIHEVGQFEITPIKHEAVKRWREAWESNGVGWISEVHSQSKIEGYTNMINYFGSSTYDSREMTILIDNIVQECKSLGIDTMPPEELKSLCEAWGR